jgi:hypothetical protein
MSSRKLGRSTEAGSALETVRRLISKASASSAKGQLGSLKDLVICRALEREAAALVKGASSTDANTSTGSGSGSGDVAGKLY